MHVFLSYTLQRSIDSSPPWSCHVEDAKGREMAHVASETSLREDTLNICPLVIHCMLEQFLGMCTVA
jgi:hypothetical protein